MPRKKLSEYRAKAILSQATGEPYSGLSTDMDDPDWNQHIDGLADTSSYVIKVDQAVKARFKKGLVKLDCRKDQLAAAASGLAAQGYRFLLVEPYQKHAADAERYLGLSRTGSGVQLSYSLQGGVDIEAHPDSIVTNSATPANAAKAAARLGMPGRDLSELIKTFDDCHWTFMELNPVLVENGRLSVLDAAVEVDEEAEFFVDGAWQASDFRSAKIRDSQEQAVAKLNDASQASLSLETINRDGSIFLLLSGGGASLVVADEMYRLGYGKQLANYGEYSGNPTTGETQLYAEQIVQLLLQSSATEKRLIIAGGIANFTDIRATFEGIIAALTTYQQQLASQTVKVFVRRGGPHETEGLRRMRDYLESAGLLGNVCGPETMLSDIVRQALQGMEAA